MTDRPILFSGPMVRAILEERKTQTRRVLNPQPDVQIWQGIQRMSPTDGRSRFRVVGEDYPDTHDDDIFIRFATGDRLYVREAWRTLHKVDCLPPRDLADDPSKITYEADPENRNPLWAFGKFRQGMHMPRWASRLTLPVTEVRVQRLQDISVDDAVAEGIERLQGGATVAYKDLWDSINAGRKDKDGNHLRYAWADNPWVVAISFDVHKGNIDQMGGV